MNTISETELQALLLDATPIESDGLGLKVARLKDGSFLKLYRRKRIISSAIFSPPAKRFAQNATKLQSLGIAAPDIEDLLSIPALNLNGVRYIPLPGDTLRNRWKSVQGAEIAEEVRRFGAFLARLHNLGIYFRSLHLGNVLLLPDGRFGLIDLSDMWISRKALSRQRRARNLKHILRYPEDIRWLAVEHRDDWVKGYASASSDTEAARFARSLIRFGA
ncbi:BUD32 family EKC/KEOPS complex subunit [Pseudomonas tohonis]|uniref:lipopolysaccharide kinase InaA family protein n=1 Tax=Pseudomonas tohonis TaxID=2725477 RepID=UPI0021DB3755|nr:lipopolysaccharide kinase InaA family protein [Pseudomonas tohonis]UXY52535.1 polymerase [Pseudomonas tohonis]